MSNSSHEVIKSRFYCTIFLDFVNTEEEQIGKRLSAQWMFFVVWPVDFILECEFVYLVYTINKLIAVLDDYYVIFIPCKLYAFIFFLGI